MYDTIVIGAGPAGMTAALYAARANLKVATLEQGAPGGQMNNTSDIENYPGFESISGPELSMKMFEPLEKLGVENLYGIVSGIEDRGNYKVVKTGDEEYQTKTVIIATGAKHRHIGVAGEEEYNSCFPCLIFFSAKGLTVNIFMLLLYQKNVIISVS